MTREEIEKYLYKTFKHEIDLTEFESWLYTFAELEHVIGSQLYFEYITLDFRDKYVYLSLEKLIKRTINLAEFEKKRICDLLVQLIESDQIGQAAELIYEEYCRGYSFLRFIGSTYISTADYDEIDVYPNEVKITPYKNKLINEAKRLLRCIEDDEILIIRETEYIDNRKIEDKIDIL